MRKGHFNHMNQKFGQAGWIVAAGLAGMMFASGFQGGTTKEGVVDIVKLGQESKVGLRNSEALRTAFLARNGLMEFAATQLVLTSEQATKLRTLSLKEPITEAEKTELEKLKEDIKASAKNFNDLNQKQNPTDADRAMLQDYNNRVQTIRRLLEAWNTEFTEELNRLEGTLRQQTIQTAKEVVKDLGKKQGYTIIFESQVAPYGANDLTDAALKALNEK